MGNNQVRFPSGCDVVGQESIYSDPNGVEVRKYYVDGVHNELHFLGPIRFQHKPSDEEKWETVVTITSGLPPEVFLG